MRALKNIPVLAGCAAALSLLGAVVFILFFWQGDISADRTGGQLVFGATYMTILVSANVLLFVLFMILPFTGKRAENQRIRALNEQLNDANTKLRDYAVELERMAEIRERNRFAREIHDTLGHTLTGIIMGADAALALFPAALEQHTLSEALAELVDKFRMSTGVEIQYEQLAGTLDLASDEEDFLCRVVQESMTNSVRHGHAEKIKITIPVPDNNWTWDDFYRICAQVTDVKEHRFGAYAYTWVNALYSNGAALFSEDGSGCYLSDGKIQKSIRFVQRLESLNEGCAVTSRDFDLGQVGFPPLPVLRVPGLSALPPAGQEVFRL